MGSQWPYKRGGLHDPSGFELPSGEPATRPTRTRTITIAGKTYTLPDTGDDLGGDTSGLTPAFIRSTRRWIADLYRKYWLRDPTPDEYAMVLDDPDYWDPQRLTERLRLESYPNAPGQTWGDRYDMKQLMQGWAREMLHRDITDAEVNHALVNGYLPTPEFMEMVFTQIRDHTTWGADPEAYINMRARIKRLFADHGITLSNREIRSDLVSQAVQGRWSDEQITEQIRGYQMPGHPDGITIGAMTDARRLAETWWDQYFPGQHLDDPQLIKMMGMSPAQMLDYIRSLPANLYNKDLPAIGVGSYTDTKLAASDALKRAGVLGVTPTNDELTLFANGKFDAEAIDNYYRNRPDLIATQPGLPYHLTREEYAKERADIEGAYSQLFGTPPDLAAVQQAAGAGGGKPGAIPAEPDWVKEVFKQGLSAQESRQMFGDYFQRLGRAPSIPEVRAFKTRHQATYRGELAGVGTRESDIGPTAPGLAGPSQNVSMGRRR